MATLTYSEKFYGWRIVGAAFVLAVFGWGLGFYGPPIYLQAVRDIRGWSLPLVSAAVTVHFLFGALVAARLPKLYLRYGLAAATKVGALSLTAGISGWAIAAEPWQLFAAALFSGAGWVAMGAAAGQRHPGAVVRAGAARGACDGLQRRQHRRRGVFAALGRCNR
jgi:uncharacterized membrane protein